MAWLGSTADLSIGERPDKLNRNAPRVYRWAMRHSCFILLLLPALLTAQHCAFDFKSIIVVHPHAAGDTAVIDGLRITLLEKDNLPATDTGTSNYLFTRNTEPSDLIHRRTFRAQGRRMFPFAGNNYVLVVPNHFHMDNYKVLVLDERPGNDGPRYRYQVIHLDPSQCKPLCGRYSDTVYPTGPGEAPLRVVDLTLFEQ